MGAPPPSAAPCQRARHAQIDPTHPHLHTSETFVAGHCGIPSPFPRARADARARAHWSPCVPTAAANVTEEGMNSSHRSVLLQNTHKHRYIKTGPAHFSSKKSTLIFEMHTVLPRLQCVGTQKRQYANRVGAKQRCITAAHSIQTEGKFKILLR